MERIILVLLTIFLFSCSQGFKENSLPTQEPALQPMTSQTSVKEDSIMEQKVRDAFTLLQKYARTSKVLQKNFSNRFILPYNRVILGTIHHNEDSTITFQGADGAV